VSTIIPGVLPAEIGDVSGSGRTSFAASTINTPADPVRAVFDAAGLRVAGGSAAAAQQDQTGGQQGKQQNQGFFQNLGLQPHTG
jgi:hypothetical protein